MIGHPVLGEVTAPQMPASPVGSSPSEVTAALGLGEAAKVTIVSPGDRAVTLVANIEQRHQVEPTFPPLAVTIYRPGEQRPHLQSATAGGQGGIRDQARQRGNKLTLSPQLTAHTADAQPGELVLIISHLSLAG